MRCMDYMYVFSKDMSEVVTLHWPIDHEINLEAGFNLPHCWIYKLLQVGLNCLKVFIKWNLVNVFILWSALPSAAWYWFPKNENSWLQLCVDNRALNNATMKNWYALPLIPEIVNRLGEARKCIVWAMGPGNPPAVRVWTRKTVRFGSRPVEKPDPLLPGGPNLAPYPSTRGFRQVWLDPSGPISRFAFRDVILMVRFRYPTVNRKRLRMVHRCSVWMY